MMKLVKIDLVWVVFLGDKVFLGCERRHEGDSL